MNEAPTDRTAGDPNPSRPSPSSHRPARPKARWRSAAAAAAVCMAVALPCAAQDLQCPVSRAAPGPGGLKETPAQIAKVGKLLASDDGVNHAPAVVADLRKRHPHAGNAELEDYLVTAYCPVVAGRHGLSLAERRARVDQFARVANAAVYVR